MRWRLTKLSSHSRWMRRVGVRITLFYPRRLRKEGRKICFRSAAHYDELIFLLSSFPSAACGDFEKKEGEEGGCLRRSEEKSNTHLSLPRLSRLPTPRRLRSQAPDSAPLFWKEPSRVPVVGSGSQGISEPRVGTDSDSGSGSLEWVGAGSRR